ncbi:Protein gir2 [Lecanora helva]
MGREEQIEEREVLESIFPDEITGQISRTLVQDHVIDRVLLDLSETSFRVSIALDVPDQDEEVGRPTILLTVSYPPSYPDEAPDLTIDPPSDGPKHPHLNPRDDAPHLLSTLSTTISESLGQAMIFTLITALKDSAEALITTRLDDVQAEADKERARAEEAENAKFHGEAVTRESFLAWRQRFGEEMEREREERRRVEEEGKSKREIRREGEEVKMTGKMLWERGLVGRVEEEEEGVDALTGVEGLKVSE